MDACNATEAVAKEIVSAPDLRVKYLGLRQKQEYLQSLCQGTRIPERVVQFALWGAGYEGPTMGANRNWILLQTAGGLVLSVDDDTRCSPAGVTDSPPDRLLLGGDYTGPGLWSYPDRESCLQALHDRNVDVLAEHQRLLGRPLAAIVDDACTRAADGVDASGLCEHLLRDLVHGGARVCVTLNGLAGDCAMHSSAGVLVNDDSATRHRTLASQDAFRQALSSRYVIWQAAVPTIGHFGAFCSMFMGIDNRGVMPPFPPVYRNEDGVFAGCIRHLIPGGYLGHVPLALIHDPEGRRSYSPDRWATVRLSDAVLTCIELCSLDCRPIGVVAGHQRLGQRLMALASRPEHDFQAEVRYGLWLRAAGILRRHCQLLETYEATPDFWAAELASEDCRLKSALQHEHYIVPVDLIPYYGYTEALAVLQRFVLHFGELLCWWPEIHARAVALRSEQPVVAPPV